MRGGEEEEARRGFHAWVNTADPWPIRAKNWPIRAKSAVNFPLGRDERLPRFDGSAKVHPASAMRAHVASRPVRDVEPGTMSRGRRLAFGAEFEPGFGSLN